MGPPQPYSDRKLKRLRLFGKIFIIIGLFFSIHGGWSLLEIYSRKMTMFELPVFTPEKGRMWSEFLAGMSVCLTGLLISLKAWGDLKQTQKPE